ncbi:toxin-antitoxin system, antitoxin component, HicB family protein [Candidatus Poribacteria bacterium]|nr:MAG: toxin-antitoxin system, antitoxin component, HicB family protein [Candidatus Poribacteria bacterium]
MRYKLSIIATPEPEGGFTITCKELPELITVGYSLDEAIENVKDAFMAVFEIYQDTGRTLPESIKISETTNPDEGSLIQLETLIPIQFEGLASVV